MEDRETKTVRTALPSIASVTSNVRHQIDQNDSTRPYKNGLSGLELLMSMAGDVNRNISTKDNSHTTTSSYTKLAENGSVSPNHASQLLRAAASVVSNGLRAFLPENFNQSGIEPTQTQYGSVSTPSQKMNNVITNNGPCSTTVSFSAQPTMSTGYSQTSQLPSKFIDNMSSSLTSLPNISLSDTDLIPHAQASASASQGDAAIPSPQVVTVPFLWRRTIEEGLVVYHSPTDDALKSMEEVKEYLLSEDTCKCGLSCPFHIEKVFNFDLSYISIPWKLTDIDLLCEKSLRSCCHRKHILSKALSTECKTVQKPVKPPPARRKAKGLSQRVPSRKAVGSRSLGQQSKKVSDLIAERNQSAASMTNSSAHTTPIPPIETVMRTMSSMESRYPSSLYSNHMDSGLRSPMLQTDMGSPPLPMLSPHGLPPVESSSGSHMVPVIAHTGFPQPPGIMSQQMYRHHMDPGMLSPGGHPGYYSMMAGPPHPGMPPYHNFPGYEYPRPPHPYSQMHSMPPPNAAQFGAPIWQARSEAPPTGQPQKKRRRRTSSRSSNGGNSDTGYTSGLSSPALTSPGQNKNPEHAASKSKSKVTDGTVLKKSNEKSELPQTKKEAETTEKPVSKPVASSSDTSVSSGNMSAAAMREVTPMMIRPPDHTMHRMPGRPMGGPYAVPNGNPMGIPPYMDPMQLPRYPVYNQGFRPMHPSLPPMYLTDQHSSYQSLPPHSAGQQVIRGVYSRPPTSTDSPLSTQVPVVINKNSEQAKTSDSKTTVESASDASKSESKPKEKKEANDGPASSDDKHEADNVSSQPKPSNSQTTTSHKMAPQPNNQHSHLMMANGFQTQFHPPGMPPGMAPSYPPNHPLAHREYMASPNANHPVHMMRAPNGQLFYRYASPRMPMPHQTMVFPQGGNPVIYPGYNNMPGPPQVNVPYGYQQSAANIVSPKRKRRKTSAKTAIESHSAILAGTEKQDKPAVETEPEKHQEVSKPNS